MAAGLARQRATRFRAWGLRISSQVAWRGPARRAWGHPPDFPAPLDSYTTGAVRLPPWEVACRRKERTRPTATRRMNGAHQMNLDLEHFAAVRPCAYHLTARENVARIRRMGLLVPAADLLTSAGRVDMLGSRRSRHLHIIVGEEKVLIRDQDRLHEGNIKFEPGWDLARLCHHLNQHVFFWPGTGVGPVPSGRRHAQRYAHERCMIARVPMLELLAANEGSARFSRCNSGSPRWTQGHAAPRGSATFVDGNTFSGAAGDVVEVVFERNVVLPASTEWASSLAGFSDWVEGRLRESCVR